VLAEDWEQLGPVERRAFVLLHADHVDIDDVVTAWTDALQHAHSLAKAERARELRGDRSVKTFGGGTHSYSVEWGRIMALEALLPGLGDVRMPDDGPRCDPITMLVAARQDAEAAFVAAVAAGEDDLWA
jgi:hypothetical protein